MLPEQNKFQTYLFSSKESNKSEKNLGWAYCNAAGIKL